MEARDRKAALQELQEQRKPYAEGYPLRFKGENRQFKVWSIPFEFLVYNQYNGRIGSAVKSFEKQDHTLNPEDSKDARIIEKFLWESKVSANEATLNSLKNIGQQKIGIVTSDGVIIDGNRRASLMKRILKDQSYSTTEKERVGNEFKAVILPTDATKEDILRLETSYQMGEDAKVEYNAIEKYLKCKDLKDVGFTDDEIADFMGEKKSNIKTYFEILNLMDEYLDYFGYNGIYTMASGHEDSFIRLNTALSQYNSGVAQMWDANKEDINDLKCVAFLYIRMDLPQMDFRQIIQKPTSTNTSIFANKDLWNNIKTILELEEVFDEKSVEETLEEHEDEDPQKVLNARDAEWKKKVEKNLSNKFKECTDVLESRQAAKEPIRLINKALSAMESIERTSPAFKTDFEQISNKLDKIIALAEQLKSTEN